MYLYARMYITHTHIRLYDFMYVLFNFVLYVLTGYVLHIFPVARLSHVFFRDLFVSISAYLYLYPFFLGIMASYLHSFIVTSLNLSLPTSDIYLSIPNSVPCSIHLKPLLNLVLPLCPGSGMKCSNKVWQQKIGFVQKISYFLLIWLKTNRAPSVNMAIEIGFF